MDVKIEKSSYGEARLIIDLKSHLAAYHSGDKTQLIQSHQALKNQIDRSLFNFQELAAAAIEDFPEESKANIIASPAYYFIGRQFVEIFKNAVDVVLQAYKAEQAYTEVMLSLDLKIEDHARENEVTIKISDNGTGFPASLLDAIGTKAQREACDYYHQRGSQKDSTSSIRLFIGGAGRGIREFMGLADKGNPNFGQDTMGINTESHAYNQSFKRPERSELNFYNNNAHGAVIEVTTSKAPLVFITQPKIMATASIDSFSSFSDRIKAKKAAAAAAKTRSKAKSPDTVTEYPAAENNTENMKKRLDNLKLGPEEESKKIDTEDNPQKGPL